MSGEFKIIKKEFDWNDKVPFEISIVFSSQYMFNGRYQRFKDLQFDNVKTIVNDYAFCELKEDIKNHKVYGDGGKHLEMEELEKLLLFYHNGFLAGLTEFETELTNTSYLSRSDKAMQRKVFLEVKGNITASLGFIYTSNDDNNNILSEAYLFNNGLRTGRLYKAWSLIIENPSLFLELFRTDEKVIDFYKVALTYCEENESRSLTEKIKQLLSDLGVNNDPLSSLTAFEIALRFNYLIKGGAEKWASPVDVGKRFQHLRHFKNIEEHFRLFDNKKNRKAKVKELENIYETLTEYKEIQKSVMNDLSNIN